MANGPDTSSTAASHKLGIAVMPCRPPGARKCAEEHQVIVHSDLNQRRMIDKAPLGPRFLLNPLQTILKGAAEKASETSTWKRNKGPELCLFDHQHTHKHLGQGHLRAPPHGVCVSVVVCNKRPFASYRTALAPHFWKVGTNSMGRSSANRRR